MYRNLNLNPIGKAHNDCLVRAIALIMEMPWEKALMDLTQYGMLIYSMPNDDDTATLYLKEKGFVRRSLPTDCPVCFSIKDFCRDHPTGEYIVLTSNHAVPVIDGFYYDAFDSGNEIVMYYWERREENAG